MSWSIALAFQKFLFINSNFFICRKTDQDIMIINLCLADWLVILIKFPLKLDVNLRYIYWSNVVQVC
ncbi:hypothetical protein QZH41_004894 [Actinostola sp. cb2023]|nr:hypothetical protein QZH41_004894 [Actinostola sp. cb2023]